MANDNSEKKAGRPAINTLADLKRSRLSNSGEKNAERFKAFISYLEKRKPVLDIDRLKDIMGVNQAGHLFDKKHGFPMTGKLAPIKKLYAYKYHIFFRIPLEFMPLEQADEDAYFENGESRDSYFTISYWETIKNSAIPLGLNPAIEVIPVSLDWQDNSRLTEAYVKLAERINRVEKEMMFWESTFKGDNNNPGKQSAYKDAQKIIFDKIRDILEVKSDVKYSRTFYLSPINEVYDIDPHEVLIDEISEQCLEHVLTCLKDPKERCKFYISNGFLRLRSHCLIDDKIFLTEDYIKYNGYVIPRILFLDSLDIPGDFDQLIKSIKDDDDRHIPIPVTFSSLEDAANSKKKYLVKLYAGEKLITRVLKLLRKEMRTTESSDLVNYLIPHLEKSINEEFSIKSRSGRKELYLLNQSLRKTDLQVFDSIITKRVAYEKGLSNRIKSLEKKITILNKLKN